MASADTPTSTPRSSMLAEMRTHEDWWSIWCAAVLLIVSFAGVWLSRPADLEDKLAAKESVKIANPLKAWLGKPGEWSSSPVEAFYKPASEQSKGVNHLFGTLGVFVVIGILFK